MEINHNVHFKEDEFDKFIEYIKTLKRKKMSINFSGNIFKENDREGAFSVYWITEEDK